jgi:hypothetical protein
VKPLAEIPHFSRSPRQAMDEKTAVVASAEVESV